MNNTLKNILAVIIGIVVGGFVNFAIIQISGTIIPPPEGADLSTADGIKAASHLLETKHYIMPFVAHALGTFVGALVVMLIAATKKIILPMSVGVFFLLGGITAALMIPAPTWFLVLDLGLAYIPMVWLGYKIKKA